MSNSPEKKEKLSVSRQALLALKEAKSRIEALESTKTEPIAVVGMACRFPGGANSPQKLWQLLSDGVDAITEIPPQRWNVDNDYDPNPETPGKMSTRSGGFLQEDIAQFDPLFFGISEREAITIDPQHRLLLEVSWEALENTGYIPRRLDNSVTGVFVGITNCEYQVITRQATDTNIASYAVTGLPLNAAAGRLSYTLGLTGPSMAIDTACSSSLVAIHQACQSLRLQECQMALAGGVNLWLLPDALIATSQAQMSSPDGRCQTFDEEANGTAWGEGCGMLVLKRLSDAQASKDNILVVISGSAVNQDGPSSGFTVPNSSSQQQVIRQALKMAKVKPSQVSYVEAHGTATSLGDPIELRSLAEVFGEERSAQEPLIIGSIKTNIGHLASAAGISGVMKVILQIQHRQIVPHLHLKNPTSKFDWKNSPLVVATQPTTWDRNEPSVIAGVSSFGASGTNAHVIIEEAPAELRIQDITERPINLLTLSAKTEKALEDLVNSYQSYLETNPELSLADVCYTANTGRAQFNHRLGVMASEATELIEKLLGWKTESELVGVFSGQPNSESPKIAFLFTGQGSQYINMGQQLYEQAPTFRQALEQCDQILQPYLETSILEIIYPKDEQKSSLVDQTAYTQPAIFALEYALFKLWDSWGIKPNVVMGHSVGEYVAACIAGVFSLEDGLKLIAMRGKLMQKLPSGGEMVSVMASESQVTESIKEYTSQVTIAAVNGPESIVISGESGAIATICDVLKNLGIKTKKLQVSHAFHSPLMEPMLTEFEAVAKQITYNEPKIPLISNVTGTEVGAEITMAEYWVGHVRQPVRFATSMKTLEEQGYETFLEIGPKPILLGMGRQCVTEDVGEWLPSLRPGVDEWQQMLSSLGQLYVKGVKIDWSGFDSDYSRQKVALPTYPFQRERYWVETTENKQKQHQNTDNINQTPIVQLLTQGNTETLTQQLETTGKLSSEKLKLLPELLDILAKQHQEQLTTATIKNWFYEIEWQPLTQTNSNTNIQPTHWLILADTTGVAEKLAQKLQQQGHEYSLVARGENYQKSTANTYQLNPHIPQEFEQLYQEIQQNTQTPITKLIHLWSLDAPLSKDLTVETLESSQIWGCGSVVHLLQTLLKNSSIPELWLITRGSQSVLSHTENHITGLAASPLWGLGRVVSLEHPQLWGGLIDLEPQAPATDQTEMLWQLLANQQEEDHLALRGEKTYVARLVNKDTPEFSQPLFLSSDSSYLITGGLGALGLHTAQWLVEKGAKNIVLTGRRPPTEKVSESIKQLEETGCQVRVLLGDVSVEADIGRILEQIQTSMPTLKGIIHAAGVLDDGTIQQMNWERFAQVMSPKLIGTWHLHTLTQNLPLDFFVCFSSIASMLGSPGQGNYAAANAFMDALASYRRSQGLSGLAINWGAWASEGMAARLAVEHQNRIKNSGINEIAPKEGMSALDLLLIQKSATAQVGVAGIQWQVLAESWSGMKINSLLRELLQQEEWLEQDTQKQKVKGELLAKLETTSNEKRQEILTEHIRRQVAQVLGFRSSKLPEVNVGLMEMGMDSLMTVELKNRLQNQLETNLPETIAIEYPTIAKLSLYIEELMGWKTTEIDPSSGETETKLMMERSRTEAIAIIGIGCRFPGNANTPESFWELLSNGQDSITEIPLERWDLDSYYDPNPESPGKMYIRHAALVEQVDKFDPQFFGISEREAHSLDPQQRFILEVTWEALERAGINPQKLENTQTGVFLGIGQNDYANLGFRQAAEDISPYDATGNGFCFVAGRLSYFLGVQGPSLAIDTACSSSLVAIHEACQSLRHGESNLALAGGVQLILSPEVTTALSKLKALAPDGKCKTFDAAADGYGRGEGCGIVVLKRLSDALKDGDRISAVIRGSAVNHDGPSSGMTVPNKLAQEKLIQKALKAAKVEPLQVSYVEAHGTGTSLGDPMEVRALARVFDQGREGENLLNIGSVKTNIGHLEAAAGIAGIIKVILQLQHQEIAPHLHLANLNPYIDWENMPLKVPTQLTPWLSKGEKRVAGVSSFGMSGTNAHIVLEEAPSIVIEVKNGDHKERPIHLLTLSGKTEKALEDLVSNYQNYLETNPELALADVCYTANTGRAQFNHRLGVMASEPTELIEKLLGWKTESELVGVFSGQPNSESPKIAFLFTGQGSQYINMGRQLYEKAPTFRRALEQCDQILQPYLETSILEIIYPKDEQKSSLIDQTAYTQPAIFALEYALFKLWDSWGLKPNVVMGHSVGEYVAACMAGVFSLEDGLKLIAMRGKLMQKLPSGGEMVSVMASESQVKEAIKEYTSQVTIAAVNGPESIVISGESGAIATICDILKNMGIKTKKLQVSHAFHSPLMEPMLTEFEAVAKQLTYNEPKIPLISNVTGTEVGAEITMAEYWVAHVRQPVRFATSMKTLEEQGYETFLEIGAKPILLGMGRQCVTEDVGEWLPSLRPGVDEWQQMLSSLGKLYVKGGNIDWSGFDSDYNRQKVALPTYPFQRERYWVETANSQTISTTQLHPLINRKFKSPLSKEIFFESEFSTHNLPFLTDHRIYEKVVVPGASHISLLLAGASLTFSTTGCQLEDIVFPQALAIPEQGVRNVQVALTPQDSSYSFQVISFDSSSSSANGSSSWALHATGKISPTMESSQHSLETIKEIQSRCRQKVESTEIYQGLWDRKIHLGESFRWIDQVWLGEGEILSQMKVPETVLDVLKYQIHPALIDSCFQSLAAFNFGLSGDESETFVPFSIDKFTFYKRPENGRLWCYARRLKDGASESKLLKTEIQLFDQTGELVAQVDDFKARKANPKALLMTLDSDLSDWFYEINWQAQPLTKTSKSPENISGKWLVFALTDELVESVGKNLQQKGEDYIWVSPGSEYRQLDAQHYQINPTIAEQFPQLLQDNSEIKGILHLWGINEVEDLQIAQQLGCATGLHLLQALIEARLTDVIPMWLVTQGTQSVLDEAEVVQPQQGSLWGLGRVISLEHPELRCGRIDLDPTSQISEVIPSLVDEMFSDSNEDQIAIRQGVRYVARLVAQEKLPILGSQPLELKLSEYGLIENLNWQVMQRRTPQGNEVEIQVKAVGLNFRDVLNSLGLLKEYYAQVLGITDVAQLTLGLECVGVIASVGENVSRWQVGDEVMALVPNGFSSFVTTAAESIMAKPKNMSFTEAATLPLTFATAYYGLQQLAKIQPGEQVLVHAAAGGVGQAAVQIAIQAGAEVFATASPPKWEFLKSMGVKHIMNSRTLEFADEIMSLTAGKGVDIVLNSLNGDFIDKSFAVLATQGRFVEIGKIGIWDQQQVMQKRPDADYFPFDIGEITQQQPGLIAKISEELNQQCQQGKLKALSYQVFSSTEVKAAFRYMQQGKHIGKVVVSLPETEDEQKSIKAGASYLVTGGLGALGLEVAQWMVKEGAKHLVLTGRRSPNETARKIIEELEAAGASVSVLLGDISTQESAIKIFEGISGLLPPLKGVIHAAGVLDDGVLQKMNWDRFTKVLAPKVSGTWYLHQLTQDLPLDFFVCFSSMASMLGNSGQGNYAAANAFMDAMAHYRRGLGLPGLSINWGAWASGGMAARLGTQHQNRSESSGMRVIKPEEGMVALEKLLSRSQSQVGVFPVNWSQFSTQVPGVEKMPLLSGLLSTQPSLGRKSGLLEKLKAIVLRERMELFTTYIRSMVAQTLGLKDGQKLEMRQPLFDLGLDSLMAVELKNRLESSLQTSLSSTLLFDYPTLEALVEYLADVIPMEFPSDLAQTENKLEEEDVHGESSSQLSDITQLSEIELEASVLQEIEALEKLI